MPTDSMAISRKDRIHWSKLPPVRGFSRISDDPGHGGRRLKCEACGTVIPSLGVGYHKQGRPCTERTA